MPLLALPILLVLVVIVLIPFSLLQRFRRGSAERPARRWVASLNIVAAALSSVLFIAGALIVSGWLPGVLGYTFGGFAIGCALGVVGFVLTQWKHVGGRLYFRPNRLLVLAITLVVAARVIYGFWRTWDTWRDGLDTLTSSAASGLPASMSAGAVVLGYYLVFWAGVRRHLGRPR